MDSAAATPSADEKTAANTPILVAAMPETHGIASVLDLFNETEDPSLASQTHEGPTQSCRKASTGAGDAADNMPSGEHFVVWLRESIQTHKLIINDARALVHTVNGTVYLVSPGIFQRYAQEHLRVAQLARAEALPDWQWVQKRFEKLGLHRKQTNGLNIWTCEVRGPRKARRVHGYLLKVDAEVFKGGLPNNPYLCLSESNGTPSTLRKQ